MSRKGASNVGGERAAGLVVETVNLQHDFEIYDALPTPLRLLLDSLPEMVASEDFVRVWLQLNLDTPAAFSLISSEIERLYPGWTRPDPQAAISSRSTPRGPARHRLKLRRR